MLTRWPKLLIFVGILLCTGRFVFALNPVRQGVNKQNFQIQSVFDLKKKGPLKDWNIYSSEATQQLGFDTLLFHRKTPNKFIGLGFRSPIAQKKAAGSPCDVEAKRLRDTGKVNITRLKPEKGWDCHIKGVRAGQDPIHIGFKTVTVATKRKNSKVELFFSASGQYSGAELKKIFSSIATPKSRKL